jgi:hypothetical protein
MLSVEYCLRRAERYRLKMLTTDEPATRARLRDIADNYICLADRCRVRQALDAVETARQQIQEEALDKVAASPGLIDL